MFNFTDLNDIHLEISNNCQASCPMCVRNLHGGLENPLVKVTNWTLDDFKTIMSEKVLRQISGFYFCGNFGDPVLNNSLLDMCKYADKINSNLSIRIHTNGSLRSKEWWHQFAKVLPKHHRVIFAIDGLADTHILYRIGTSFDKIIENATAFINAGGTAEWAFIRFKHNEHQEMQAEEMARKIGFHSFAVKNSSRFLVEPKVTVLDRQGQPTHTIEPATDTPMKFIDKKIIQAYKEITSSSTISCHVKKQKEIYIDAFKEVYPCCWLASTPYTFIEDDEVAEVRHEMIKQHHSMIDALGGRENLNAVNKTLEEIINSNEYQNVWEHFWYKEKLITCARTCGTTSITNFSKSYDQQTRVTTYEQ